MGSVLTLWDPTGASATGVSNRTLKAVPAAPMWMNAFNVQAPVTMSARILLDLTPAPVPKVTVSMLTVVGVVISTSVPRGRLLQRVNTNV